MFTPPGSERSAAPADSVIPGPCAFVVMSLRPQGSLPLLGSLRIGRPCQGLATGLPHKFLPSPVRFVQDAGTKEPEQPPLERDRLALRRDSMHKSNF